MEDLSNLKYSELQKYAKKLGIKANQKADKIITAIRELSSEPTPTDTVSASDKECCTTTTDSEHDDKHAKPSRAKKGRGRKRKQAAPTEQFTSDEEYPETLKKDKVTIVKVATPRLGTPKSATPRSGIPKPVITPKPGTPRAAATPQSARCLKTTTPQMASTGRAITPAAATTSVRARTPAVSGSTQTPRSAVKSASKSSTAERVMSSNKKQPIKRRSRSCHTEDTKSPKNINSSLMTDDEDEEVVLRPKRHSRSNTYTKDAPSPNVKELIEAMRDDMTKEEQKESLMAVLDQKANQTKTLQKQSSLTNIPRFTGLPAKAKTENPAETKKKTPGKDWSKVHQRQWDKMDSLDEYLAKKRKRTESMSQSVKKLKLMTEQMRANMQSLKKPKTPNSVRTPGSVSKQASSNASKGALFQSPAHSGVPFKPKVTSTANINLNFGKMYTKDKATTGGAKTPATNTSASTRKSPRVGVSKSSGNLPKPLFTVGKTGKTPAPGPKKPAATPSASKENLSRKSVGRKSMATPFKANNTADSSYVTESQKKFDIKASLSKPMTWKPHTGKLKPFSFGKLYKHETEVKEVKVKTRDDRRHEVKQRRANKRNESQMSRRGINA